MFFSLSPFLYFSIMNIYFSHGKKIKFMFKEEAGLNHSVMNRAFHGMYWTQIVRQVCTAMTGR